MKGESGKWTIQECRDKLKEACRKCRGWGAKEFCREDVCLMTTIRRVFLHQHRDVPDYILNEVLKEKK